MLQTLANLYLQEPEEYMGLDPEDAGSSRAEHIVEYWRVFRKRMHSYDKDLNALSKKPGDGANTLLGVLEAWRNRWLHTEKKY